MNESLMKNIIMESIRLELKIEELYKLFIHTIPAGVKTLITK
ncbi:hypothetical protein ACFL6H_08160 [Candidatus Latescibacterota bacterium]